MSDSSGDGLRTAVSVILLFLTALLAMALIMEYARGVITNDRYMVLYMSMAVLSLVGMGLFFFLDLRRDSLDEEGAAANSLFLAKRTWIAATPYIPLVFFTVIGISTLIFTRTSGLSFFNVANHFAQTTTIAPKIQVTWLDRLLLDGMMQGWLEEVFGFVVACTTTYGLLALLRNSTGADVSSPLVVIPARLFGVIVATVLFVVMHGSQVTNQAFQGSAWIFEFVMQGLNQIFGIPLSMLVHIPHNIGSLWYQGGFAIASSTLLAFAGSGATSSLIMPWRFRMTSSRTINCGVSPRNWKRERLPKIGQRFPDEGDVLDCPCGQRMKYIVVGEEEGAGFHCNDCDNQVWCYLDEDTGESYWEENGTKVPAAPPKAKASGIRSRGVL